MTPGKQNILLTHLIDHLFKSYALLLKASFTLVLHPLYDRSKTRMEFYGVKLV